MLRWERTPILVPPRSKIMGYLAAPRALAAPERARPAGGARVGGAAYPRPPEVEDHGLPGLGEVHPGPGALDARPVEVPERLRAPRRPRVPAAGGGLTAGPPAA